MSTRSQEQLFFAVMSDSCTWARELIGYGADVNHKNNNGDSPFHHAVNSKNPNMVRLFLENGGEPNVADGRGSLPLCLAIRYGAVDVARILLEYKADVNLTDAEGLSPKDYAAQSGDAAIIELIAQYCPNGYDDIKPLVMEHERREREKKRCIDEEFARQRAAAVESARAAAEARRKLAESLPKGQPPQLSEEARKELQELYELFLMYENDVPKAMVPVVEAFMQSGDAHYCSKCGGATLLHFACAYLKADLVDALLLYGADPNAEQAYFVVENPPGCHCDAQFPLSLSAEHGAMGHGMMDKSESDARGRAIVWLLLAAGADPHKRYSESAGWRAGKCLSETWGYCRSDGTVEEDEERSWAIEVWLDKAIWEYEYMTGKAD